VHWSSGSQAGTSLLGPPWGRVHWEENANFAPEPWTEVSNQCAGEHRSPLRHGALAHLSEKVCSAREHLSFLMLKLYLHAWHSQDSSQPKQAAKLRFLREMTWLSWGQSMGQGLNSTLLSLKAAFGLLGCRKWSDVPLKISLRLNCGICSKYWGKPEQIQLLLSPENQQGRKYAIILFFCIFQ